MKLIDALKRDVKLSLKTIRFEFPRFLSFFVVLFLLQALFCSIFTLYANNDRTQLAYLEDQYRIPSGTVYHLRLLGCNADQRALLHNLEIDQDEDQEIFHLLGADITSAENVTQSRYDLYIRFEGDIKSSYERFRSRYQVALSDIGNYTEAETLLLSYEMDRASNRAILVLQLAMVVTLGALAVWVLHTIMTNHYKFTYGIYLSFGADFLRLFRTSIWEMIWAALFTWLPAIGVSNLLCWLIFRQTGFDYQISISSLIVTLLISLLTVGISVFASLKVVSRKPPVQLLVADDNSNLIHSPRRSNQMIGLTFPNGLGRLSFGRYWKYTLRLLAMTLSFAMLFVAGFTLANCYQRMLNTPIALYQVNFDVPNSASVFVPSEDETDDIDEEDGEDTPKTDYASYGYTEEVSALFSEFPNLGTVYKESYFAARSVRSHALVSDDSVGLGAGGISIKYNADGDLGSTEKCRALINVNYQAIDEEIIESFDFLGYGVEGDLHSVLTEANTIAVTDGFLGASQFNWKVGDTVRVGLPTTDTLSKILEEEALMMYVTDENQLLSFYFNAGEYEYYTFTVGAIISDFPAESNWSIFFSPADYEEITGYSPIYESVDIYAAPDATEEEEQELYEYLRKAEFLYSNMSVIDLNARDAREIEENKNYSGVFMFFAVFLLAISPMVWIFSQILFYYKRRQEFDIYLAIGAPLDSIRKLMWQDALRYAGISAILFLVLALPVSWIVYRIIGFGTAFLGGEMLASFKLPWISYLIGAAVSALSGMVSTLLPWFTYKKQDSPLRQSGDATSTKEDTVNE